MRFSLPFWTSAISLLSVVVVIVQGEEDPVNFIIESEVKQLDESNFIGDHYLIQKVDRVNKLTTYSNPDLSPEKPGADVFFRHSSDSEKDIVVLKAREDYLKQTGKKSVYVVLKRVPKDPKRYVVFYAYIRDPVKSDDANAIVTIAGKKKRIEFDIWDHRGGSRNSNRAFGWTTCERTLRTFCKKHDQEAALEMAEYDTADIEEEKGSADGMKKAKLTNATTIMKAMPGYDPQENYDFFWDLDNTDDEAQAVGKITSVVAYQESTISQTAVIAAAAFPIVLTRMGEAFGLNVSGLTSELLGTVGMDKLNHALKSTSKSINLLSDVVSSVKESQKDKDPAPPIAGRKRSVAGEDVFFFSDPNGFVNDETKQMYQRGLLGGGGPLGAVTGVVDGLTGSLGIGKVDDLLDGLLGGSGLLGGLLGGGGGGKGGAGGGGDLLGGLLGNLLGGGGAPGGAGGAGGGGGGGLLGLGGLVGGLPVVGGLVGGLPVVGGLLGGGGGGGGAGGADLLGGLVGSLTGILGGGGGGKGGAGGSPDLLGGLLGNLLGSGGGGLLGGLPVVGGLLGGGGGGGGGGLLGGLLGGVTGGLLGGLLGGGRSVEGVNAASKDMDTDMFTRYGWLTQDIATPDLDKINEKLSSIVFMGYGSCPWLNPTPEEFLASQDVEHSSVFVLKLLRTQCSEEKLIQIKDVIGTRCLQLNPDKSLQITPDCKLRSKLKLTKRETGALSNIHELELITRGYVSLKGGAKATPKTPDGLDVSTKMYGFVQTGLMGVDLATDKYGIHAMMLLRNKAMTAKYGFVKLLQDYFRMKACPACTEVLQQTKNDLIYLGGLIQFYYAGLGPVLQGTPAIEAFEEWYLINKENIVKNVHIYIKL